MNRWLAAGGVVLVLAGILVWECVASEDPLEPTVARVIPPRVGDAPRPDARDLKSVAEAVQGRPLFSPERRPLAEAAADQPAAEAPPRLAGVIVGPSQRSAIFADGAGHPRIVGEGGTIGRFTVHVIEPNRVILRSREGDLPLRPAYSKGRMPDTVAAERPDAARAALRALGAAD